jgi:hypothetical protein
VHSCSLDAEAQNERASTLRRTVFSKATAAPELPDGYAFVFHEPIAFAQELEDIAAFERTCCAGFVWEVTSTDTVQELRVTAPGAKAEIGEVLHKLGWLR